MGLVSRRRGASEIHKGSSSRNPKGRGFRPIRPQDEVSENDSSYRQVALSQGTLTLLSAWLQELGSTDQQAWLFSTENNTPIWRNNVWLRNMQPKLKAIGLDWATFQVMRRTFATLSKQAGVDAHTRSAQMGNTVNVNENEYAISSFEDRLAAVRRLETNVVQ